MTTSGASRAALVARPLPDADTGLAVLDRLIHRQPLRLRLLAGDDNVDAVAGLQAVVADPEQCVGIRRQVDADDIGLLVGDEIDEARILVGEAVVVLPPDMRGEQVVEARISAFATPARG